VVDDDNNDRLVGNVFNLQLIKDEAIKAILVRHHFIIIVRNIVYIYWIILQLESVKMFCAVWSSEQPSIHTFSVAHILEEVRKGLFKFSLATLLSVFRM